MPDTSITWADVILIAPDLSTLTVSQQNAILAQVELQMNTVWGDKIDLGAVWLAAHIGTLIKRATAGSGGGASGPVTQETVGQVSRSYANVFSIALGSFSLTPFGMEYERLLMQLPGARFDVA